MDPPAKAITLRGIDLHDGTILRSHGLDYLYGTEYGCGFTWAVPYTPWCGYGVSESRSLRGPWTAPILLFSPQATADSTGWTLDNGLTWNTICSGQSALGCFNPRMVYNPTTRQWLLWFNDLADNIRSSFTNDEVSGYWVMGCEGPAGPCGSSVPGEFDHKPNLPYCNLPGDDSVLTQGTEAAIICAPGPNLTLDEEGLTPNWEDGAPAHTVYASGSAEGVGGFQLADGQWEIVYSTPGCGYCSGPPTDIHGEVHAGYAIGPSILGPWTDEGLLSSGYCKGQPRTVFKVSGLAYELVDEWTGAYNETTAALLMEPMGASPWSCS
ncbi:MAG: hypothetical protein WBF51_04120 [Candidatus Dormiibacterota bacterium]